MGSRNPPPVPDSRFDARRGGGSRLYGDHEAPISELLCLVIGLDT